MSTWKLGTCSSCEYKGKVIEFTQAQITNRKTFHFCYLCYSSFAGNVTQYPRQYEAGRNGEIIQHICKIGNLILDAIVTGQDPRRTNE